MATNNLKRKRKDEAGTNPGEKGNGKAKPVTKVTEAQIAPKKPTVPGVRLSRTRPYLAGTIIAKYGLAAGVTDAMVAELDRAYGKPNSIKSTNCLTSAHHAARGYLGFAEGALE